MDIIESMDISESPGSPEIPEVFVSSIYAATYSSVTVLEMLIQDVAVMRRINDSYLNATQILKIAGLDKTKRSKILEREVHIGEHKKVQGGYGKYQGTWIPRDRARELAEKYHVLDLVQPLVDFDMALIAEGGTDCLPTKEQALGCRRRYIEETESMTDSRSPGPLSPDYDFPSPTSTSPPKTALKTPAAGAPSPVNNALVRASPSSSLTAPTPSHKKVKLSPPAKDDPNINEYHRNVLMAIFLSNDPNHIPDLLKKSKGSLDLNLNLLIDEQGHTALHWAVALARIKTAKLLVKKGADVCHGNYMGETPLMRGVIVTNSFDNECFPQMLKVLTASIPVVDHKSRTVFHHTALTAGIAGRATAAIFYMRQLIDTVKNDKQFDLSILLQVKDNQGKTALDIAKSLNCTEMVEMLEACQPVEEEKMLEDQDPVIAIPLPESQQTETVARENKAVSHFIQRTYGSSQRGREIVSTVQKIVDELDAEHNNELYSLDTQLNQVHEELRQVTAQLELTRKKLKERQSETQQLAEAHARIQKLEATIRAGWHNLDVLKLDDGTESEDIDALFTLTTDVSEEDKTPRERHLERQIRRLLARIQAYTKNGQDLQAEVENLRAQSSEREMQCKRLIAICCDLPIEQVDELIEPLTLAIENDPPDLDVNRVIGFMERMKRQSMSSSIPAESTSVKDPMSTQQHI
ncbi:uncharacterized protein BYT42DRAFT_603008 [Radiomyces spectabilis]|uniref:uncharacterized protein n=1 Tax=Radiomyces spectabilis TaxID=64574 RepID=UPI002220F94B|nr:uncharacterized protein BYT42DRAFT_603008 [Radiomyces spectabilis]KAI8388506.1 hypothetical protein BYT42DRAFT_603008 [Radiomyces spectabilis]